jgi:Domain of unknown function (DUF1929)
MKALTQIIAVFALLVACSNPTPNTSAANTSPISPQIIGTVVGAVDVFQNLSFGGILQELELRDTQYVLPIQGVPDNSIRSLRVAVGYTLRACNAADGTGTCRDFPAGDYATLGPLDSMISYLLVKSHRVIVFNDSGYQGIFQSLGEGFYSSAPVAPQQTLAYDDQITSLRVAPGYYVQLCVHPGGGDLCRVYPSGDHSQLSSNSPGNDHDIDNNVSYAQVWLDGAIAYRGTNYVGTWQSFDLGVESNFGTVGLRRINSLQIAPGRTARICTGAGGTGSCADLVAGNYPNLTNIQGVNFGNAISWMSVWDGAESRGRWSAPINLPIIPVAAALLPSGKVLYWSANHKWSGYDTGRGVSGTQTYTAVFDPATNATNDSIPPISHNMFCPGTALLADGRVLVNGGGGDNAVSTTSLFHEGTATWTSSATMNMKLPRWYNSSVTLPNGNVFTLAGNKVSRYNGLPNSGAGEVFNVTTATWNLNSATTLPLVTGSTTPQDTSGTYTGPQSESAYSGDYQRAEEHPRLFVAPNGNLFVPGPTRRMFWYNTADWTDQPAVDRGTFVPAGNVDNVVQNNVTVMFDVGKILVAGGNHCYGKTCPSSASNQDAHIITLGSGTSVTVQRIADMAFKRAYANGVILPTGDVLIVGGSTTDSGFTDTGRVLEPELFRAGSQTFQSNLASMRIARNYHSLALLLPDGRVFVGGGGLCLSSTPNPANCQNHADAEIYSPSYVTKGAARSIITSIPSSITYGASFTVSTSPTNIASFSFIRMSSVTHTVNTDQRFMRLGFTSSGSNFKVMSPANANIAPPGYYMLFAVDSAGIPSVAKIITLR